MITVSHKHGRVSQAKDWAHLLPGTFFGRVSYYIENGEIERARCEDANNRTLWVARPTVEDDENWYVYFTGRQDINGGRIVVYDNLSYGNALIEGAIYYREHNLKVSVADKRSEPFSVHAEE